MEPRYNTNGDVRSPKRNVVEEHKSGTVADDRGRPILYSAPTVESIGDESTLIRPYAASRTQSSRSTPVSPPRRHLNTKVSSPPRPTRKTSQKQNSPHTRVKRAQHVREDKDFPLNDENTMHMSVRVVPIANLSAFALHPAPSLESWYRAAQNVSSKRKLSPSLQHLKLMHRLQSITHVRQVAFHNVGEVPEMWELSDVLSDKTIPGIYQSIDPIQATKAALPKTAPYLSNKKRRLPMRADVGFPDTPMEEIQAKQVEIQQETEWEEASPRLVVLVTSDDLGTAVQDEEVQRDEALDKMRESWNGGGLEGMPWAGPELQQAKHFSKVLLRRNNRSPKKAKQIPTHWRKPKLSMLAPPLDAIISKSMTWKPRPYQDRPPRTLYRVCCPLKVHFEVGSFEPLLCSMALYSLPIDNNSFPTGKLTEDFWFPAGDWSGRVALESVQEKDDHGNVRPLSEEKMKAILDRKYKALFSYHPSIAESEEKNIHIVIRVYKVAHADPVSAYLTSRKSNGGSQGLRKQLAKKLKKKSILLDSDFLHSDLQVANTKYKSAVVLDNFGTQFLTPLCFGTTSLFASSEVEKPVWPKSSTTRISFFRHPEKPESQEEFYERLRRISSLESEPVPDAGTLPVAGHSENNTVISTAASGLSAPDASPGPYSLAASSASVDQSSVLTGSETPKKKGIRAFLSPQKRRSKKEAKETPQTTSTPSPPILDKDTKIDGYAIVLASSVGGDFLDVLRSQPDELGEKSGTISGTLADVPGDSAIMLSKKPPVVDSSGNRKSNLQKMVKLPNASVPSGYARYSEYREVQFLPPRTDKVQPTDSPPSYRSTMNLLFIYPRLLRTGVQVPSAAHSSPQQQFTVRIRLLKTSMEVDNLSGSMQSANTVLKSFFNPAPWSGDTLLKVVYTRILMYDHDKSFDPLTAGIPFDDEFKMRIPEILDGNYFLSFTLFSVGFFDDLCDESTNADNESSVDDCGIAVRAVAETTIPLSSSATRDPVSGIKVATIIPNGIHRLKMGDYQLHVETRLLSSIHVPDPAVSVTLREFPFQHHGTAGLRSEMALVSSKSVLSRQVSSDSVAEKTSFATLLSSASGSCIAAYSFPLLFMHLSNLINPIPSDGQSSSSAETFLLDNFRSLFEMLRRIKLTMLAEFGESPGAERIDEFIKCFLDSFDEDIVQPNGSPASEETPNDDTSEVMGMFEDSDHQVNENVPQAVDGGAIRRRPKRVLGDALDIRISRSYSAVEYPSTPLTRVAYGATKTDRMKLEAEMDADTSRMTHLLDDDDTLVPYSSNTRALTEISMVDAKQAFSKITPDLGGYNADGKRFDDVVIGEGSILEEPVTQENAFSSDKFDDPDVETELGRRVRSVAQVMLAPCVTPSLASILSGRAGSRRKPSKSRTDFAKSMAEDHSSNPRGAPDDRRHKSSREEIDNEPAADNEMSDENYYQNSSGCFRSSSHTPVLTFCVEEASTAGIGSFLYESIMLSWCRSWAQHSPADDARLSLGKGDASLFYLHLDFLLRLCLKSMCLRYYRVVGPRHQSSDRVIIDETHMNVFKGVIGAVARQLIDQAAIDGEKGLFAALKSSEIVLDFLVGLSSIVHAANFSELICHFIYALRGEEKVESEKEDHPFSWNRENLFRAQASRQLRIRAAERLSVLPNFVPLNFPEAFGEVCKGEPSRSSTWKSQQTSNGEVHVAQGRTGLEGAQNLLPRSGWLSDLLTTELLSICSKSCELVVVEAMKHIERLDQSVETTARVSQGRGLERGDLLSLQSIAIHSITCMYELLLRRHSMDRRYQTDRARSRIAGMFARSILEGSLASVRWLARMESTHKIRSLWLLCFVYVLQEAPDEYIRESLRKYCDPKDMRIHRFIRLMRLSSSTFQSFIDQPRHSMFPAEIDKGISPWLLQESFNTLCATGIVLVEQCASLRSSSPVDQKSVIRGILDLLLHILTTPQSSVTHLRAVGGAIQVLDKFGASVFLDATGTNLQHWLRIILSLMNSIALSVRSVAVDFAVSLLGSSFDIFGNIDELALVFVSVLPEVVAREAALCSVDGLVKSIEHIEQAIWPLRRSFADLEDTNPLDDSRVDPQLSPILSNLCRACQAVMDGVIVEIRLMGSQCIIVGTKLQDFPLGSSIALFDADEESLFEAASFFSPETGPMQRMRWLTTLRKLHVAKGQWIEAAECLVLCARTIADAIPHFDRVWRPSRFVLWSDSRRSLWLSTVGEDLGHPERGNEQVMDFADNFLEHSEIFGLDAGDPIGRLAQPSVPGMCHMLIALVKEAAELFDRESGADEVAYNRIESVIRILMDVMDDLRLNGKSHQHLGNLAARQKFAEEEASLRKAIAALNGEMTKLAEKLLLISSERTTGKSTQQRGSVGLQKTTQPYYVRLQLSGKKPSRFQESTSIPTFLTWNAPTICRVPKNVVEKSEASDSFEKTLCAEFVRPIHRLLLDGGTNVHLVLGTDSVVQSRDQEETLILEVSLVKNMPTELNVKPWEDSKHFYYRKGVADSDAAKTSKDDIAFVELTVVHKFPCALSRQSALFASEFHPFKENMAI